MKQFQTFLKNESKFHCLLTAAAIFCCVIFANSVNAQSEANKELKNTATLSAKPASNVALPKNALISQSATPATSAKPVNENKMPAAENASTQNPENSSSTALRMSTAPRTSKTVNPAGSIPDPGK